MEDNFRIPISFAKAVNDDDKAQVKIINEINNKDLSNCNKVVLTEVPDKGICKERNCKTKAEKDYNGHGHWVCKYHYEKLNDYFDEEYR